MADETGRELSYQEVLTQSRDIDKSLYEHPYNHFRPLSAERLSRITRQKLKPPDAVPTPFPSWNAMCRDSGGGIGLAHGWYVIVGGGSNTGKTMLALNLAVSALRHGENVLMISMEMAESEVATRMAAMASGTDVRLLEHGSTFDIDAAESADQSLIDLTGTFLLNDIAIRDLDDIVKVIEFYSRVEGCRTFILDYLQLIAAGTSEQIYERTTLISQKVRDAAKAHNVLVIGISQLRRGATNERKVPPSIHDLIGGSSLENDSDQVILLNHADYERDQENRTATTELILGKNRFGPDGSIPIVWDYSDLTAREPYLHERLDRESYG